MKNELKATPLKEEHVKLGARMVEFAGFLMPVSYSGIIEEHNAVRNASGLFDVSHMGEFMVEGEGALGFLDNLVTNDCSKLLPRRVLYTVMCRENGTVVDDLLVYRLDSPSGPSYMLIVNAANIEKDWEHLQSLPKKNVKITNLSDDFALIAVQGPSSREILNCCPSFSGAKGILEALPYYHHTDFLYGNNKCLISRTGYTGELGFEILVPNDVVSGLWREILDIGARWNIKPAGLAARDTLRFEASFCLYGHELDDCTTPLEAGLDWVVKFSKKNFSGKQALLEQKSKGLEKHIIGLEVEGRNIARQGFDVFRNESQTGTVTSGNFSPTLEKSLCMAMVKSDPAGAGADYSIAVRNKFVPASPTGLPFYRSRSK